VDRFREPVATARTGKQFKEEVFVLGIEGTKALRDDLDGRGFHFSRGASSLA
jgi:hypothetical protein